MFKRVIKNLAMFSTLAQLNVCNSAFQVMFKVTCLFDGKDMGALCLPTLLLSNAELFLVVLYLLTVMFSSSVYGIWTYLCAAI